MNLVLGVDTGDGCQDGFEGTECFGCPFASSIASAVRPRVRPTQPLSLPSSGQHGAQCNQNTKITSRPPGPDQVINISVILATAEYKFWSGL